MTRQSWPAVYEMTAMEFLNVLAYRNDKIEKNNKEREQWRRTH